METSPARGEPHRPWFTVFMSEFDTDPTPARTRRTKRDWALDVGVLGASVLLGALSLLGPFLSTPRSPRWVLVLAVVGGALACACVWWWRRWPLLTTLLCAALLVVSPAASAPAGALTFRTIVHHPLRTALVVMPVAVAGWLVRLVLYPVGPLPYGWYVLIVVVSGAALLAWALLVRARRQLVRSYADRARQAEADQQLRLAEARRSERTRIAREMHDVLAHRLSLLSMHAGALEFRPDAPPTEVAEAAGVVRANAHQALQDLREVIGVLRAGSPEDGGYHSATPGIPAETRPQPTFADLPALVEEAAGAGMRVAFDCAVGDAADVPAGLGRTAYRIVQEGLTNARKHAPGAPVTVTVDGAGGEQLTVEVRNRLAGRVRGDVPGTGTGLVGVAERVSLAGGTMEHGPAPGGEFRLRASLPWRA